MSEILSKIKAAHDGMADFRNARQRAKRYAYGRQWDDLVDIDGQWVRESDYIRSQGSIPLKNNLIRKLVRSVLGVFRNSYAFPEPERLGLDPSLQKDAQRYARLTMLADANRLGDLYARTMEEFLISGMAVHRKTPDSTLPSLPGTAPAGMVRTDFVSPDAFFFDPGARDFRGWDTSFLGEIHDVDFPTLCSTFAADREECDRLRGIYAAQTPRDSLLSPSSEGLCRVFEVWMLDCRERYRIRDEKEGRIFKMEAEEYDRLPAAQRKRMDARWCCEKVWRYAFVAPSGEIIREGDSPLCDGGHPYIWTAYPFIDGEIHSFVDDVIDQQRFTNRLITLYDWVLRSSAKGVLLFPQEAVPQGGDIEQIVDEWSKFNGVIIYKSKGATQIPQQVSGTAAHGGITELLNIQLKMFEDISGVNSALQGRLESRTTSGTLYNSQMRQALVSLQDLLDTFAAFIRECAVRELALLP